MPFAYFGNSFETLKIGFITFCSIEKLIEISVQRLAKSEGIAITIQKKEEFAQQH